MSQFAAVVVYHDRGDAEEDIARVIVHDSPAEVATSVEELATDIIKEMKWDDPRVGYVITRSGRTWSADNEPIFTIVILPVEFK